ncbi:MAG TPA: hypothetical protein VF657_21250, partial [Actinoplanes sp.]
MSLARHSLRQAPARTSTSTQFRSTPAERRNGVVDRYSGSPSQRYIKNLTLVDRNRVGVGRGGTTARFAAAESIRRCWFGFA